MCGTKEGQVGVGDCQFEPYKLSVDSKTGSRERVVEVCKRCNSIKGSHLFCNLKDLVGSLQTMGVFFSIIKV